MKKPTGYPRLILASKSPRRRYLLEQTGLEFSVIPSGLDEDLVLPSSPDAYVRCLAEAKAKDVPPPPPPPASSEKEVFFIVEDMPKYPGGFEALNEYIGKMQKKIAVSKKVKGTAKVAFTVNAKGQVNDIKVVEKDNDGAAKGAFMIAKEMKDWKPGKQRGKAVPVKYLLPVEFK